MTELAEVFGPQGLLSRSFEGYVSRPSQLAMAERVAQAIEWREHLLVEAGTGTGKTFAYLVPALLSGRRVLVSTGTRTLQDQLHARDLPLLATAVGRPLTTALLKGRGNYLCLQRLDAMPAQQAMFGDGEQRLMGEVREWARRTRSGDLAELASLGESHPLRAQLSSTRESCTGARCPRYAGCHVFAARRAALEADMVVVNHHLLLADLTLKEDGYGELLPGVDALIIDEAHQLPDLAAESFGLSCSSRQLELLLADTRGACAAARLAPGETLRLLALIEEPLRALGAALGRGERRVGWEELDGASRSACAALAAGARACARALAAMDAQAGLAEFAARATALAATLAQLLAPGDAPAAAPADAGAAEADGQQAEVIAGARMMETGARGWRFSLSPYDIAPRFRALLDRHPAAWIFTSATLAIAGDFSHYARRMGLTDAGTLCLDSPFDYERQALLYLPQGLPEPSAADYTGRVLDAARPLLEAADGGAFLLFTSHRALRAAAGLLRDADWARGWPLLAQGDAPREQLLRRFRDSGHAVLLGTASFWEGVDVQGAALRLVVIDKLPFAAPDDPLVRARVRFLESQGANPFRDYQLPEAAISLKQGVGRLVRSEEDRGVVMICDPRLARRSYGRALLAALPPLRPTIEEDEALRLLARCAPARVAA